MVSFEFTNHAMGLHFAIVFHPIEMSQRLLNLSLRFFVLATVLLAESGSSTFNITRFTTGDVFQNTNSSQSCNESGASCVFDGENSPFCGVNCCNCYCPSESPTYLMKTGIVAPKVTWCPFWKLKVKYKVSVFLFQRRFKAKLNVEGAILKSRFVRQNAFNSRVFGRRKS